MKSRFAFIDCVRGYAVLLVFTNHLAYAYPELPYPVHRLAMLGWHGVQLFFIASAVTLMMSWTREREKFGTTSVSHFFARRLFRIAPAYYLAGVVYYFLEPPAGGFDFGPVAASLAFVNAWYPSWTATTPAGWTVVPGGWSIGVEFTFYAVFPFLAVFATSFRRALILAAGAVVIGCFCNDTAGPILLKSFDTQSVLNFLYFWFPNQFAVFAIGICLFFGIVHVRRDERTALRATLQRWSTPLALCAAFLFISLAYVRLPQVLSVHDVRPPILMVAALFLAAFVMMVSVREKSLLVNPVAAFIGKVSFSAYLWHFAVLHQLPGRFPDLFHANATGVEAIVAFAVGWVVLCPIVVAVSYITYHLVEDPMIRLGQRMIVGTSAPRTQVNELAQGPGAA